jgi:glutamine synthetase
LGEGCAELEVGILKSLDKASAGMGKALTKLYDDTKKAEQLTEALETAAFYQSTVLADMDELRKYADEAEALIPEKYLSYPTYGEMLFSLR